MHPDFDYKDAIGRLTQTNFLWPGKQLSYFINPQRGLMTPGMEQVLLGIENLF